jgi:hypothetical protein
VANEQPVRIGVAGGGCRLPGGAVVGGGGALAQVFQESSFVVEQVYAMHQFG